MGESRDKKPQADCNGCGCGPTDRHADWCPYLKAREDAQPVAWSFELATVRDMETGEYSSWGAPRLSFAKPCVSEGSIRNLTALGPIAHPAPGSVLAVAAALKPFAMASRGLSSRWADHETHWQGATTPIAVEDLRRADQALAALQQEPTS